MALAIAVIVGSLRRDSLNRRLAEALVALPQGANCTFTFPIIGDLPLYDQDDDGDQPAAARRLRDWIFASRGVIFVTPEYNRSIPGVLKNALDHGSRPIGLSCWKGKPAGVLGISPSPVGTAAAQMHLRGVLAALDMPTLGHPEIYLSMTRSPFTEDGALTESAATLLGGWLRAFIDHARCAGTEQTHPDGVQ